MGLISQSFRLTDSKVEIKSKEKAIVVTGEGFEGQEIKTEVYQQNGVYSSPPNGVKGVWLPVGGSNRYGVVVATNNYNLTIDVKPGETAIYSTDKSGTRKALIKLKDDGSIEINGDSKRLVTADELQTALTTLCNTLALHVHPSDGAVSPGLVGLSCDISTAKTQTVKTGG